MYEHQPSVMIHFLAEIVVVRGDEAMRDEQAGSTPPPVAGELEFPRMFVGDVGTFAPRQNGFVRSGRPEFDYRLRAHGQQVGIAELAVGIAVRRADGVGLLRQNRSKHLFSLVGVKGLIYNTNKTIFCQDGIYIFD